ncbi:hypothetical protein [Priestia megaterium]
MKYDKVKYNRGKLNIVTQTMIYVEGKNNKIFYQQFKELQRVFIENGGNCNNIEAKVNLRPNSYGIIDRDYTDTNHAKLFSINFYSIENISLIYIEALKELREKIIKYVEEHGLDSTRISIPKLEINYGEDNRVRDYNLQLTLKKHHDQYKDYIENAINCEQTFMRYKDLKKVIESYVYFAKNKYSTRINYITDLVESLPCKSIEVIFDTNNLNRLKQVL